jgi:hypothetical protein
VGTAHPVFFLPEMALGAQLVAMVHVHPDTGFGFQNIAFLFIVTGKAGQRFFATAMIQLDVTMGYCSCPGNTYRFIVMALAAFKALHFILAGFGPESPALISGSHQNRILR